jgi:hypothetical protein
MLLETHRQNSFQDSKTYLAYLGMLVLDPRLLCQGIDQHFVIQTRCRMECVPVPHILKIPRREIR